MLTTLALVAALTTGQGQSDQLALTNIRSLYCPFGNERKENKLLLGDILNLEYDIEGLKVAEDGRATYNMGLEVTNSQGKLVYGQNPQEQKSYLALGGSRVPALVRFEVGNTLTVGEYTIKVTVKDLASNAKQSFARKFEVLPKDFGLVRLTISGDPNGLLPLPPSGPVGLMLYSGFSAVGFERDSNGQPNVLVEMRILDESGKTTLPKPITGEVNADIPKSSALIPMQFIVGLNRPGKFTVELRGTDRISKKTAKLTFPLTVTEPRAEASAEK